MYNCRHPSDPCPDDSLLSDSASNLAKWLQIYAVSTRKNNGEKYSAKTVYLLLGGLQRYMKENKKHPFNMFDRDHPDFKLVVRTCDNYFRGVGMGSHATEVLIPENEQKLWTTGVLPVDTPKALLNAMFFYNGKNFLLRGGAKHRNLKFSQVTRSIDDDEPLCCTHLHVLSTYLQEKLFFLIVWQLVKAFPHQ